MSDSATEAGPSGTGGRMFMRPPPPVINIIAPTDSPSINNNIEPGPSGDHQNQHGPQSSGDVLSNSNSTHEELPDDFQCDFGFMLGEKISLSTLQVQQPIELDYAPIPNNSELTNFIGKAKKKRFYCRRGAVVLQQSPVGRYFQGKTKIIA